MRKIHDTPAGTTAIPCLYSELERGPLGAVGQFASYDEAAKYLARRDYYYAANNSSKWKGWPVDDDQVQIFTRRGRRKDKQMRKSVENLAMVTYNFYVRRFDTGEKRWLGKCSIVRKPMPGYAQKAEAEAAAKLEQELLLKGIVSIEMQAKIIGDRIALFVCLDDLKAQLQKK